MPERLRVGIIGAAGYTGAELVRLIHRHPRLSLEYVAAKERAGQTLEQALPSTAGIRGVGDRVLESFDPEKASELRKRCDVVFTALPHEASARAAPALLEADLMVLDLSAAFRIKDVAAYEPWYGAHPTPSLLPRSVYGLPELHRSELPGARLIAVPGCYPTSALLALCPLLSSGLVHSDGIVIDAKSGVSGAGRGSATSAHHFSETAEGFRPYKVAGAHRHTPEIEQELSHVAGARITVVFTPHLLPMIRGILATTYARAKPGTTAEACREAARAMYREGLVTVLPEGRLPDTLHVRGSARAHVAYAFDARSGFVLGMTAIDNLAKGASAQALQALNVASGWPDELGLPEVAMFP
jgi:N-acetyl-gamma-glutamyl-phosphate reductase